MAETKSPLLRCVTSIDHIPKGFTEVTVPTVNGLAELPDVGAITVIIELPSVNLGLGTAAKAWVAVK